MVIFKMAFSGDHRADVTDGLSICVQAKLGY